MKFLLDHEDEDLLQQANWFIAPNGYVVGNIDGKMTYLHRVILSRKLSRDLIKGEDTDHINRNRSDNRRLNLRVATRSQNLMNKIADKQACSGYVGVYYDQMLKKKPWKAQVVHKTIGRFTTKEQAAKARDEFIDQHNLNFVRKNNV